MFRKTHRPLSIYFGILPNPSKSVNAWRNIPAVTVEIPILRIRGACCSVSPTVSSEAAQDAAELLRVLADPTRLSMLVTLRAAAHPVCICDFLTAYGLSQPTISHHMGKLRRAGLVTAQKDGIWIYYQATTPLPPLVEAVLANVGDQMVVRGA